MRSKRCSTETRESSIGEAPSRHASFDLVSRGIRLSTASSSRSPRRPFTQTPAFSTIAIWETSIKFALNKPDFQVDPKVLREGLLNQGYEELSITSNHAIAVSALPHIHRDPFDRLLIAQAIAEDVTLLSSDSVIAQYPGPIRLL